MLESTNSDPGYIILIMLHLLLIFFIQVQCCIKLFVVVDVEENIANAPCLL